MSDGWIGVDFDGTLAEYNGWVAPTHCGAPVPAMVERVKEWLRQGWEVRIFTARVWPIVQVIRDGTFPLQYVSEKGSAVDPIQERCHTAAIAAASIQAWSLEHIGAVLPITCVKDYGMVELYDDRAVQVRPNTGELVGASTRGLA